MNRLEDFPVISVKNNANVISTLRNTRIQISQRQQKGPDMSQKTSQSMFSRSHDTLARTKEFNSHQKVQFIGRPIRLTRSEELVEKFALNSRNWEKHYRDNRRRRI